MTAEYHEILDGLFHACVWAAYLDDADTHAIGLAPFTA
jgi:hypothetical protein